MRRGFQEQQTLNGTGKTAIQFESRLRVHKVLSMLNNPTFVAGDARLVIQGPEMPRSC